MVTSIVRRKPNKIALRKLATQYVKDCNYKVNKNKTVSGHRIIWKSIDHVAKVLWHMGVIVQEGKGKQWKFADSYAKIPYPYIMK